MKEIYKLHQRAEEVYFIEKRLNDVIEISTNTCSLLNKEKC